MGQLDLVGMAPGQFRLLGQVDDMTITRKNTSQGSQTDVY